MIEIKDLYFKYKDAEVLKDINIKINDGKRIAYVEVPTKEKGLAIGRDGKNIEKVKKLSLRHHNINDVVIQ